MIKSESITKIAPALISFNSKISKISKDANNPFHKNKYATLDQIIDEVRPILNENKLIVMQNTHGEEGSVTVKTFLLHESGEWLESEGTTLKLAKNDPQGAGAGITYARRYDICAFLSLNTGEDDDGNSASGISKDKQKTQQKESYSQAPKKASDKQIKLIHAKANDYIKARGEGVADDVTGALKKKIGLDSLTDATSSQASSMIKQLDTWLEKVSQTA